jgi:hypothetical protein
MKGIAGDQRQQLTGGSLQNPGLVRKHYIGEFDTVKVLPSRNRDSDEIARLNFTQMPKKSIAMRGKRYIARLSWQRSPRDMSNRDSKDLR